MFEFTEQKRLRLFRENHLFSREDILKSFELFMEHEKVKLNNIRSDIAHKNRIQLCEKFLNTIKNCKLPVLSDLWYFYDYEFLIDSIALNLCDAVDFDIQDKEMDTMTYSIENVLLNIECDYLSVTQFAAMHKVDVGTVIKWINRGKLRHAKKVGDEWFIANTQDKPGRRFDFVKYELKRDERITNNEFPVLSMSDSIYICQDENEKSKYNCSFSNYDNNIYNKMELSKNEIERLEYIIIESGKARIEASIQFNPLIHEATEEDIGEDE